MKELLLIQGKQIHESKGDFKMKKVLSIVLVVVVALGTMAVAFADTAVDEAVAREAECVYGEGMELGDGHRYGLNDEDGARGKGQNAEGTMSKERLGQGPQNGQGEFNGQGPQDGRGAGNGQGLNGRQQRLQDGTHSGIGNGQRLMDTENCPNL